MHPELEMCTLHEVREPFEHRDGLVDIAFAQPQKASGPIGMDTAVGVIRGLGNPYPFLSGNPAFDESTALGEAEREAAAGMRRSQSRQTEALIEQSAVERCQVLAEVLYRLTVVPQATVDKPQIVLRHDCEADIPQSWRQSPGRAGRT